jgi:two-component system phosphate regulon sensor histidine kinase PhoR
VKSKSRKLRAEAHLGEIGLRTILDSMMEAVLVVAPSGRVVLTNKALDALLDRDALGSRPKKLIQSEQLRQAVRNARKHRVATEVEIEGAIGERVVTFHAQVSPLPGPGGVVVVLHDVSSLKSADRVRRDFVANAAHELRTPLTAIRGYAETLVDGALADPTVATTFLDGILRQTERLQRLGDDLSLLSRAESNGPDYEPSPTDVADVCRESAAGVAALAAEKTLEVRLVLPEEPIVLPLSGRALEEVLVNLLENAIKHSTEGGEVRLTMRDGEDAIWIEVRDDGVGIASEYHTRIFERFFRVDQGRSRKDGGSGLGLSIVRNLVQRMGGVIAVKSALGKGARFRITLPKGHARIRA